MTNNRQFKVIIGGMKFEATKADVKWPAPSEEVIPIYLPTLETDESGKLKFENGLPVLKTRRGKVLYTVKYWIRKVEV